MAEGGEERRPLLRVAGEEHSARDGYSSPAFNYTSINVKGPQFCHSSLLSNTDVASRDHTPSSPSPEPETVEVRVYTRRWYILILYFVLATNHFMVWNTFGPISSTAEDAFGWEDSMIALLSNWGPISYLLAGVFFSWVLDVKGQCVMSMHSHDRDDEDN